jgi:uncharacterized repeat protein (TIGR01451 family)
MFEPNRGQSNPNVKFLARGAGYSLLLDADGAVLASRRAHNSSHPDSGAKLLRMKLAGGNRSAFVSGEERLPGKSNYFIGSDPAKWRRDIPQFARVRYENIYPGINLVFYGSQGQLEYDFQVAPGANPARPELEFDGSTKLELEGGDLVLHGEGDSVRLHAPHVYQRLGSREQSVEGHFALRAANRVGFEVGRYDHSRELIIDPTLTYSTYFGGSGSESNASVAVDTAGNIYLVGTTDSPMSSFPQPPSGSPTQIGVKANIFVAKLSPQNATSGVEYLTFLGGSGTDTSAGIAVDGGGNAFIAGTTSSTGYPTTPTAYQTAPAAKGPQCTSGCTSVFVSVLNSAGSALNYSSYLSGNGNDIASGMTIDNRSNLFVTGTTTSNDQPGITDAFPAAIPPTAKQPAFQSLPFAPIQFFVTKVNTASAGVFSIAYSTYFGGGNPINATAAGGGIAVDSTGNVYFTGTTNFLFTGIGRPPDFPILNAYQPCLDQAPPTTIVNPVTCTNTTPPPTATDAFIAKLNPNVAAPQSQLLWSSYFGGSADDSGTGIALDSGAANIYITGTTNSPDITIPTSIAAYQKCLDTPVNPPTCTPPTPPATDAYVARLNNPVTGNTSLTYFSYLGGTGNDTGSAITVDTANGALLTGSTNSTDFPFFPKSCAVPPCVIQSHPAGAQNAFFAHINTTTTTGTPVGEYVTYFGGNVTDNGTSIALDLGLNAYIAGDTMSDVNFPLAGFVQGHLNGSKDAFVAKLGTEAFLTVCGRLSTQTTCPPTGPTPLVSAGSQATFTYTITNNGPDLASGITFTDSLTGQPITFNSASATSGSCTQPTANNPVQCSIGTLQSGSTATVNIVLTPTSSGASGQFSFSPGAVTVSWGNPFSSITAATVSVQASDFQVTVSPSNQTVSAGQTAVYTVALTPQPLYGGSVSLTCSANVPSQASCNFTTNPVTIPSTSPVTSTLNLTTTARPVTTAAAPLSGPIYAIWLGLPGIAFLGIGAGSCHRRGKILAVFLCILFALLLLQPACSSKRTTTALGGTPAGTYTITLTATSGTATHNYPFTLTVN